MSEGLDFSGAGAAADQLTLGDKLNRDVGSLLEKKRQSSRPWPVLSPSMLDGVCPRKTAYDYHRELAEWEKYQKLRREGEEHKYIAPKKFDGKLLRIFEYGTSDEAVALAELRSIGFKILTQGEDGRQIGFKMCFEKDWARLRGKIDGIVVESPYPEIATPCLWEHKALNHKYSTAMKSGGLKKTKPNYYMQVQVYMPYMGLHANPCFFTWRNKDNQETYAELVPFDPAEGQRASEWLAKILESKRPEDLAQAGVSISAPECKWCDHRDRCWTEAASAPARTMDLVTKPGWI